MVPPVYSSPQGGEKRGGEMMSSQLITSFSFSEVTKFQSRYYFWNYSRVVSYCVSLLLEKTLVWAPGNVIWNILYIKAERICDLFLPLQIQCCFLWLSQHRLSMERELSALGPPALGPNLRHVEVNRERTVLYCYFVLYKYFDWSFLCLELGLQKRKQYTYTFYYKQEVSRKKHVPILSESICTILSQLQPSHVTWIQH